MCKNKGNCKKNYEYYIIIMVLMLILISIVYSINQVINKKNMDPKFQIILVVCSVLSIAICFILTVIAIENSKKESKNIYPNSAFLMEVSDSLNEVFIVIKEKNRQAEYIFLNANNLLGIAVEELYSNIEMFLDYCDKDSVEEFRDFFNGADLKEGIEKLIKYYKPNSKEERWINISMKYIEHYERYVMMMNDVTDDVKKHELVIEALKNEKAANDARINFLSNMSQEIRTPLNAIIGRTTIVMQEAKSEKEKSEIRKIVTSAKGLLYMMNDILDMARMSDGSFKIIPEEFEIDDLIKRLEKFGKEKAQLKQVRLIIEEERNYSGNFVGDLLRLEQAIKNVLDNAIKFTPKDGTVCMSLKERESDVEGNSRLTITIEDNGCGMSKEFQKKAFEPFEQEAEYDKNLAKMGCGLGLSISKRIINKIGGDISIESKKGTGTKVKIDLEIQRVKREFITDSNQNEIEESAKYDFSDKVFLFVEDNELNREIELELLKDTGAILECAEDGKEAYDMFVNSTEGYYDAVLMDIRMPVWDGYQSTAAIRKLDRKDAKSIPIIALTANAFSEDINKSYECGMDAHVSKPIDIRILCKVINKLTN